MCDCQGCGLARAAATLGHMLWLMQYRVIPATEGCSQLTGLRKFQQAESRNEPRERDVPMEEHHSEAGGLLPEMG